MVAGAAVPHLIPSQIHLLIHPAILRAHQCDFLGVDILLHPDLRAGLKVYSDWPTFPQVYLKGEFLGGSDILIEMYNSGTLKEKIEIELAS